MRPPDGAWGIPNDKGEWNGMIGMVKRNVGLSISQDLINEKKYYHCNSCLEINVFCLLLFRIL